jgi:hypothetical protein
VRAATGTHRLLEVFGIERAARPQTARRNDRSSLMLLRSEQSVG